MHAIGNVVPHGFCSAAYRSTDDAAHSHLISYRAYHDAVPCALLVANTATLCRAQDGPLCRWLA